MKSSAPQHRACRAPECPTRGARLSLTLLSADSTVEQGIEQQLERGWVPQAVEDLEEVRLRQKAFPTVKGLGEKSESQSSAHFHLLPWLEPGCFLQVLREGKEFVTVSELIAMANIRPTAFHIQPPQWLGL